MATEGKNEKNEKPLSQNQEPETQDSKLTDSKSSVPDQGQLSETPEITKPLENDASKPENEKKPLQPEEKDTTDPTDDKGEEEKTPKTPADEDPPELKEQLAETPETIKPLENAASTPEKEKKPLQPEEKNTTGPTDDKGEEKETPKTPPVKAPSELQEQLAETPTTTKPLESDVSKPENEKKPPQPEEKNITGPTDDKGEEKETPKTPADEKHHHESPELHDTPDHEEEHHLDYSNYSKIQLVQVLHSLLKSTDMSQVNKIIKEIKPVYDELFFSLKDKAYKQYLEDGGEKDGFEYKGDDSDRQFRESYDTLKERRNNYFNSQVKSREDNLVTKQSLLELLRRIVDSEETTASIADLKKIEQEWRSIGPVAPQHARSLWANFHALRNRFYDHRSIYFELKELDRNKNLKLKSHIIDKAEQLENTESLKDAIRELNELHEEFKLIGPVPHEEQEPLWQRFKVASDKIYANRKHYYEELKEKFKINLTAKEALIDKIREFSTFDSDRITEWNDKTKELLGVQKEWESIGGLQKDKAKKINKAFWSEFKTFFNRKGHFFKKIEESRKENLEKKKAILEKANDLKNSEDFDKTAEALKHLQKQWREIGPVPIKYKDKIYKEFKKACDSFFNQRRKHLEQVENSYEDNLKKKEALCEELKKMGEGTINLDRITEIEASWGKIGFVPKNSIKSIQKKFLDTINALVDAAEIPDRDKHIYKFKARFSKMNYGPNADKFLQQKENTLRRQVTKLENDINLWRNNLDFFAKSRTADKLKEEFNKKISDAERELQEYKDQLKVLNKI